MICSRHCSKEISCLDLPLVAVKAMPTKHFSAWRLNKGEQASVDSDLATWEAALPLDLSEEEKTTLREDERKRLIRLVQQKKHDASLQKQCAAGAKTKSNANAKGAEKAAAKHVSDASSPGDGCGSNQEYYELVKQDLAVISKVLNCDLKEMLPIPIAATVQDTTGIQDG
jgi:hypothetical protein